MDMLRINLETQKYELPVRMAKSRKDAIGAAEAGLAYVKYAQDLIAPLHKVKPDQISEQVRAKGAWMRVFILENQS